MRPLGSFSNLSLSVKEAAAYLVVYPRGNRKRGDVAFYCLRKAFSYHNFFQEDARVARERSVINVISVKIYDPMFADISLLLSAQFYYCTANC